MILKDPEGGSPDWKYRNGAMLVALKMLVFLGVSGVLLSGYAIYKGADYGAIMGLLGSLTVTFGGLVGKHSHDSTQESIARGERDGEV